MTLLITILFYVCIVCFCLGITLAVVIVWRERHHDRDVRAFASKLPIHWDGDTCIVFTGSPAEWAAVRLLDDYSRRLCDFPTLQQLAKASALRLSPARRVVPHDHRAGFFLRLSNAIQRAL